MVVRSISQERKTWKSREPRIGKKMREGLTSTGNGNKMLIRDHDSDDGDCNVKDDDEELAMQVLNHHTL